MAWPFGRRPLVQPQAPLRDAHKRTDDEARSLVQGVSVLRRGQSAHNDRLPQPSTVDLGRSAAAAPSLAANFAALRAASRVGNGSEYVPLAS
jgi:hypothetical protein